ncbi:tetratricopeptide repeat protein [Streptomyces sp. NPDC002082]|uniref:tetratricopeptide repeat protein n=1 Tax=Streptomyces sp. NPDC002082 TaxID=3154772 RepID=UPI0033213D22
MINSGNATATHGGFANTGIYSPTVHLPPEAMRPPAEVDAPAGLDNLPHRPSLFVGRGEELDRLDAALAAPGAALVQAVHGLGGIGKSTLAAHWAATRPHGCAPVRWITADSPAGVQQGLAGLTTALQPVLAKALPVEGLAEWGLQWLASHTGWLLILDNVNDPADIASVIARAPGGRFLITSRLATVWRDATTLVCLDVMEEAESMALLSRLATTAGDLDGAADLCAELGHLPLAIEQVAAYLDQNLLTTPRGYLQLLTQHPAAMYSRGGATTPAQRTIARIWDITLDQIATRQPAAADLLRTLAWYAPENIPSTLADGSTDPPALHQAIGLLTAYSMITVDPAAGTLAVHRLVQALARISDPDDPHRTPSHINHAREQATSNLCDALPPTLNDPATWPTWRTLLPHIDALAEHTAPDTDSSITARLFQMAGRFLTEQGLAARGILRLERALATYERVLGDDHPDALESRNHLAHAYRVAGDLGRAIPLFEQTLADRSRVLGEDDPETLGSGNNLALAYLEAGDLARAIPLYEQTLTDELRVLGEDHPDTLTSGDNLARAYLEVGNLPRAIALFEQTLADRLRVLGEDHPDTLSSRNNLAQSYAQAGDLDRAISLYEQTLTDELRVLGEDHPTTLTSGSNLAVAYQQAGDLDRAIPLQERNLHDRLRVLGPDHPDTLGSRNNLACAYLSAGDLARGIPLCEQTLADRLRVLGEDHPATLTSGSNLAYAYEEAGDLDRAIPLHEQNLRDRLRVLGPDHPDTLGSHCSLAFAYLKAGDLAHAISLLKAALANCEQRLGSDHAFTQMVQGNLSMAHAIAYDQERAATTPAPPDHRLPPDSHTSTSRDVPAAPRTDHAVVAATKLLEERTNALGPDHPHTLQARAGLAYSRGMAGDPAGAAATQEELLEACLHVLGPDHPDTLTTLGILGHWREEAGDHSASAAAWKKLLAARVRVLGPDHPDTITAWDLLASSLGKAGDPDGAAAALEEVVASRTRFLGPDHPDHPDTLAARGQLAYCQGMAGDTNRAATAFTQLLADYLRVLGPDHPDTRATREGAAYWRTRADDQTR